MAYMKRDIEAVILEVTGSYAALIVTGARQVGKSTTLRQLSAPDRKEVTLDDLEARRIAQTDPELFLSMYKPPLLIDEVQYAPQLFSRIKMEIDNGAAPGSYWMTGSQPFRLMELAQESLAGRAAILHMSALSQREIYGGDRLQPFTLRFPELQERAKGRTPIDAAAQYERIWKGSLPGHISGQYPQRDIFYSSYLQTYIRRDIKDMMEDVDSLLFADFVRAAACRAGQMLNVHDIALDVGVSDDTAKRWLGLLEKSDVIFYLRPYSNNLLKRTVKTPKMYFFDTGLVAYLTKYSSPEILMNGAINGALLENYAVAEIMKSYGNLGLEAICHYYRDKDSKEIDLILESDGELHPVEIKKTASPPTELTGAFKVLDKASIPRGTGAVICTKRELSALDRGTMIVPVWVL
ncbi:MAG: DUF4143 domain-containing protein [Oscillospiraceae bacterium]|jgi:predicted AAA+ superfamily ATPase|nr:DUF4143 domain-containing protein [Oscillospiraceae bacterium]